jgi:alkanesulfonate monooxygenase
MWPDTVAATAATVADLRARAAAHGRTLRFGFRVHVVVGDTEAQARQAADHLVAALDPEVGDAIRARSLDSQSVGVRRQAELREASGDDGYVERHLWTGIGRARSGCGAAIVGDPQQVADTIREYAALGIDAFILSGYPHLDQCRRVAADVLPLLRR